MQLTRRDAIAAVAAGGFGAMIVGRSGSIEDSPEAASSGDVTLSDDEIETLMAATEFIYPSEVEATTSFVKAYTNTMGEERTRGMRDALDLVESAAQRTFGTEFRSLPVEKREALFRRLNVGRAGSKMHGGDAERIRYYVVNGPLYALFTTPKGSQLFGIENPIGYPGGHESYQPDKGEGWSGTWAGWPPSDGNGSQQPDEEEGAQS